MEELGSGRSGERRRALGGPRQSCLWWRTRRTRDAHAELFSYGTLQQEDVQRATFGRRLTGVSDALVGYRQSMVAIDDPEVVRTSGKTHHPIVAFTGHSDDHVAGMVFEITDAELAHADAYEVAAYIRVKRRSRRAWKPGSTSTPAASLQRGE